MKINTIITAIGNKSLNDKLIKEKYNIVCTDIQYKEGILEFLEANSKVDYIILNEDLDGNITLEELVSEIKKINKNSRIIFTSNKSYDEERIFNILKNSIDKKEKNYINNKQIENLKKENKKDKFEDSTKFRKKVKPEIKEKVLKRNKKNNKTENEEWILDFKEKELKNIKNNIYNNKSLNLREEELSEKQEKNIDKNIFNKKTLPLNNLFNFNQVVRNNRKEVIAILGPNGIGKSVFSILFAKTMESKKSIIIDFDVFNKSLHTIMGIKNYDEKIKRKIKHNNLITNKYILNKSIIHTNLKIDLLPAMDVILDPNYKLSNKKMKNIIEELKDIYDLIIIDTSSETFFDYTREMINCSNKSIFISGANILEVRKSERLLEIYNKDWNIEKEKINIVFNKCTKKSLDESLLKEIFSKYNILGKIQLSDYYDFIVNKNMSEPSSLKKEIESIKKQIIKEKYYGIS